MAAVPKAEDSFHRLDEIADRAQVQVLEPSKLLLFLPNFSWDEIPLPNFFKKPSEDREIGGIVDPFPQTMLFHQLCLTKFLEMIGQF